MKTNIELILISRQLPDSGLSAPKYVLKTIFDTKKKVEYRRGDSFWIIVDTDKWKLEEIEFLCKEHEISVIVSNPCFEIWILFHYMQRNKVNTIKEYPSCSDVADTIKEDFNTHFSKNSPVTKDTFQGLGSAVFIAKYLDTNHKNIIPTNPGSRMYKLINELQRHQE